MLAVVDSLEAGIATRSDCLRVAYLAARGLRGESGESWESGESEVHGESGGRGESGESGETDDSVLENEAFDLAIASVRNLEREAEAASNVNDWDRQRIDRYLVEVYKKNSMAVACLIFVLVGVPLGLAVARAGVGLVASLAVAVFLFYWVTLVQGEKLADRGLLSPAIGMWSANVVVGLIGMYLTTREAVDPAWRDPFRRSRPR
jgi:lipopolysaccharide export system permease protein